MNFCHVKDRELTMKPRIGVRRISAVGFCVALTFFALFAARIGAAPKTFKVAGRVLGASGKNAVYVTAVAGRWISDEARARNQD
jgi:hypothetical protein